MERTHRSTPRGFSVLILGRIGDVYARGGLFMHLILASLLVGVVCIVDRLLTLRRARVDAVRLVSEVLRTVETEGVEAALKVCEQTRGPVAAVLHAGLLRAGFGPDAAREAIEAAGDIEVSFLERGLAVIATVARVAPVLGFLGAASGARNALGAIEAAGSVSASAVGPGFNEALISVVAGFCAAIACEIGRSYCAGAIGRLEGEMEEAATALMNGLAAVSKR